MALWTSSAEKLNTAARRSSASRGGASSIDRSAGWPQFACRLPGALPAVCDWKEELDFFFTVCVCVRVYVLQSLNRAPLPPARQGFSVYIASTEQRIYFLAITGINPLQTAWNGSYLSQG